MRLEARMKISGRARAAAPLLVGTEMVTAAGAPTFRVTDGGSLQVAPRGAPVQVKETEPEKLVPGVSWRL